METIYLIMKGEIIMLRKILSYVLVIWSVFAFLGINLFKVIPSKR